MKRLLVLVVLVLAACGTTQQSGSLQANSVTVTQGDRTATVTVAWTGTVNPGCRWQVLVSTPALPEPRDVPVAWLPQRGNSIWAQEGQVNASLLHPTDLERVLITQPVRSPVSVVYTAPHIKGVVRTMTTQTCQGKIKQRSPITTRTVL